jgi:MraZ protein
MYFGNFKTVCRVKNRIAFPARLRRQTGDVLLITNWFENSLLVLPKKEWEALVSEIFEKASFLLPEVRDLERFIYGGTFEIELDSEGRFIIPSYLKEYAKIQKDVVFTGGMWYMQLWSEEVFLNYQALAALQIKDKAVQVFEQLYEKKSK